MQLKQFAKQFPRVGPFYARDIATDAFDVLRNAGSFFESKEGRAEQDAHGRAGRDAKRDTTQIASNTGVIVCETDCDCRSAGADRDAIAITSEDENKRTAVVLSLLIPAFDAIILRR